MKVKNIYPMSPLTEAGHPFKSATLQVTADGKGSNLHAVVNYVNLFVQSTFQLPSFFSF